MTSGCFCRMSLHLSTRIYWIRICVKDNSSTSSYTYHLVIDKNIKFHTYSVSYSKTSFHTQETICKNLAKMSIRKIFMFLFLLHSRVFELIPLLFCHYKWLALSYVIRLKYITGVFFNYLSVQLIITAFNEILANLLLL